MTMCFEKQLEAIVQKYVHKEVCTGIEGKKAIFMSFDAIVEKEGGRHNAANIKAAKKRCLRCISMGKRYAKRDGWSDRTNFAFIIEEWSAMKSNSWGIETSGDGAAPAVGACGDGSSSAEVPAGGKGSTTGGKGAGTEKPGGKGTSGRNQPRDRTSLEKTLRRRVR